MGDVIEVGKLSKCSICGKRQATILCDMPIGSIKNLHIKNDYENSFKRLTVTCDRAVCEKCAIEVNSGIHFCKHCLSKVIKDTTTK